MDITKGSSKSNPMEGSRRRHHALLFPFPAQGHINPIIQFGKLLVAQGILVTMVNTEFTHHRMSKSGLAEELRYEVIPDGLPPDHGRTLSLPELCKSVAEKCPLHLEKVVQKLMHSDTLPPLTFIVSDGVLSFAQEAADKYSIPRVAFWTTSACGFSAYFHMPLLIDNGYIPLAGEEKEEQIISCIPAMSTLKMRDLPSFVRAKDASDFMFQHLNKEAQATLKAAAVVINTFDELERPVLDQLSSYFPVMAIGPLLNQGKESIWSEESSCLEWLDTQAASSVVYVCFGSIAVLSEDDLLEFAWGLEASKQPFLWAMRPDLLHGESAILSQQFLQQVKERSCFVSWAPQRKVLAHPAVGGFLTHSGWNSTLESIAEGVGMICCPFYAEQFTNRRFVTDVWKIGLEMKGKPVFRADVEALVRRLMMPDGEAEEIRKRAHYLKESARSAFTPGGSSYNNLQRLLVHIDASASPSQ